MKPKTFFLFFCLSWICGITPLLAQTERETLMLAERPQLQSRNPQAIYLEDILATTQRVFIHVNTDAALYITAAAENSLGAVAQGSTVEMLAFTEYGVLVRALQEDGNITLGWVGRDYLLLPEQEAMTAFEALNERRIRVEQLIEEGEVALGMTHNEVLRSLGEPDESEIRQTIDGSSGRMAWVEVREIPQYRILQDPYTGQAYRQLVGKQRIEESRLEVEFEQELVTAISENRDNRRSHETLQVPTPILIPCWQSNTGASGKLIVIICTEKSLVSRRRKLLLLPITGDFFDKEARRFAKQMATSSLPEVPIRKRRSPPIPYGVHNSPLNLTESVLAEPFLVCSDSAKNTNSFGLKGT